MPFLTTQACQLLHSYILNNASHQAPRLAHPDLSRKICLQTDASDTGLGAVLFQENSEGKKDIIEYACRKLSPIEKNYCTAEKKV